MFEAGLFPGVNYYLSCWYKRSEFGIRAATFFSAAAVAGSCGGLLAWAIERMEGLGGRHGWSWIFIIEGLVTLCIAIASFFMVKDFPENATFLSDRNLARVKYRLAMDKQASAKYEAFDYDISRPLSQTIKCTWACSFTWVVTCHCMPSRSSCPRSSRNWVTPQPKPSCSPSRLFCGSKKFTALVS